MRALVCSVLASIVFVALTATAANAARSCRQIASAHTNGVATHIRASHVTCKKARAVARLGASDLTQAFDRGDENPDVGIQPGRGYGWFCNFTNIRTFRVVCVGDGNNPGRVTFMIVYGD